MMQSNSSVGRLRTNPSLETAINKVFNSAVGTTLLSFFSSWPLSTGVRHGTDCWLGQPAEATLREPQGDRFSVTYSKAGRAEKKEIDELL